LALPETHAMSEWVAIDYRHYWDVPREFVVRRGNDAYFFECAFDESLDDYPPNFCIYRIPAAAVELPTERWGEFREIGERFSDISVDQLRFHVEPIAEHPMHRSLRFIHESVFDILQRPRSLG
jgi:hypothetical protein